MAGNIKGITIKLGADTTQLSTALKNVNSSAQATQKNLTAVNKALKLNPGNVDLLREKQNLLNQRIKETKTKLDALKQAQAQLDASGVDKNSEEYKKLRADILNAETSLQQLNKESKSFGSVGAQAVAAVGEKFKAVGGKITEVGTGLSKSVTAPILGVGAASVAAFKEVDAGLDIIVKKTGMTGDELEDMKTRAQNIATTIPTSFETAGTAIGEVNTRFGLTGDELESLSTKFIEFAALNNTDVNSSIDGVQQVLSAFGLTAADAGPMLDTLNKVGQDTGIGMDSLAATLVSNATAFQGFGLNAADAAHLLGQLEKSGIDTSVVMTGMSKVQVAAMKDGISMQDAFTNALSSSDSAIEIFGAKAGPKLYSAFQQGTLSADMFTTSQHSLNDALGSVSDTYEGTLDPITNLTTTMNELKTIGADLVSAVGPQLTDIFKRVGEVVKSLSDKWKGLSDEQKETIVKVAGIAAAVGPLLVVFGKVISVIGTIMTMAPALAAGFAALSGPVGIAVAVIAGLIAIGVALGKHWDEVVAWTKNLAKSIADGFNKILNSVKTAVTNTWNAVSSAFRNIVSAITNAVNTAKNTVSSVFNAIKSTISSVLNSAFSVVQTVVNNIKNAFNFSLSIPNIATGALDVAKGAVDSVVGWIKGAFNFSLSLPSVATGVFSGVVSTVQGIVDKVKGAMNFSWSLPALKVPQIVVTGGKAPWGLAGQGTPPSIDIKWHRDAYNNPLLFTRPTVMATPNGLHGFGDGAGGELVIGVNKLRQMLGTTGNNININVYANPGMNETALANAVAVKLDKWLGERV